MLRMGVTGNQYIYLIIKDVENELSNKIVKLD